jgi:NAD(P)-dependent dehydrogenase (short-subunit alcohol dehydrogenase family)
MADHFTADDLMFKPGLMKGERILITGGGTGLGKVMAEACLMLGATVYIIGRRGGVLEATAKELMDAHPSEDGGGKVVPKACDIRVPEAIHDMLDEVWADGGALTGLVNNAAGNFISRTQDLSPRGFDAIANIVFRGSGLRQALDRRGQTRLGHLHPDHLGVERQPLHRALGHEQGGPERHDPVPGRGVGRQGHPLQRHRPGALPHRGDERAAQSRAAEGQ